MIDLNEIVKTCHELRLPYVDFENKVIIYLPNVENIMRSLDVYKDGTCFMWSTDEKWNTSNVHVKITKTKKIIDALKEAL